MPTNGFIISCSAVVCAILRMTTTVEFGQSSDKMYTICPVILWATGEMTCGFFICCMQFLPRVFKETSWLHWLRKLTHMRFSSFGRTKSAVYRAKAQAQAHPRTQRTVVAPNFSRGTDLEDVYYEIESENVELGSIKGHESTEKLRKGTSDAGIMRTTEYTVTHEQRGVTAHRAGSGILKVNSCALNRHWE